MRIALSIIRTPADFGSQEPLRLWTGTKLIILTGQSPDPARLAESICAELLGILERWLA